MKFSTTALLSLLLCGFVSGKHLLRGSAQTQTIVSNERELGTAANKPCYDSPLPFKVNGVKQTCANRSSHEVTFPIVRNCPKSTHSCGWPPLYHDTEGEFFVPCENDAGCLKTCKNVSSVDCRNQAVVMLCPEACGASWAASKSPTEAPSTSNAPSMAPTPAASNAPSAAPTNVPTEEPSSEPTNVPSELPSQVPTNVPSSSPSKIPSMLPSTVPSGSPTFETDSPTYMDLPIYLEVTPSPTSSPSESPSEIPTAAPTPEPLYSWMYYAEDYDPTVLGPDDTIYWDPFCVESVQNECYPKKITRDIDGFQFKIKRFGNSEKKSCKERFGNICTIDWTRSKAFVTTKQSLLFPFVFNRCNKMEFIVYDCRQEKCEHNTAGCKYLNMDQGMKPP